MRPPPLVSSEREKKRKDRLSGVRELPNECPPERHTPAGGGAASGWGATFSALAGGGASKETFSALAGGGASKESSG